MLLSQDSALVARLGREMPPLVDIAPSHTLVPLAGVEVVLFDVRDVARDRISARAELPLLVLADRHGQGASPLRSAAAGVVWRDAPADTLVAATLAVAAGLRVSERPLGGRRRLAQARAHQTPASQPLTSREREVLPLLAEGMANKDIAGVLGVSINTIKYHLAEIMRKLGVRSRTEAVVAATRAGLLQL